MYEGDNPNHCRFVNANIERCSFEGQLTDISYLPLQLWALYFIHSLHLLNDDRAVVYRDNVLISSIVHCGQS